MVCNKSGYPRSRYKYHSKEKCNSFDPSKTNKDLGERIDKYDATYKKLWKTDKKIHKHMKALNNHNRMLFRLYNNSSSCCELNKINQAMIPQVEMTVTSL